MLTRLLTATLATLLLLAPTGCRQKCHPRTKSYMTRWLGRLCEAEAQALRPPANPPEAWRDLRLARAARPPQRLLPPAPLLVLSPTSTSVGSRRLPEPLSSAALRAALGLPDTAYTGKGKAGTDPAKTGLKGKVGTAPAKTAQSASTTGKTGTGKVGNRGENRGTEARVYLAVAPETPVHKVATTLKLLSDLGIRRISFLVEPTNAPLLPSVPDGGHLADLERLLTNAGHNGRENLLRRRFSLLAHRGSCGALETLLSKVKRSPATAQCPQLARELPAVVAGCACRMDWRRLLTITYLMLGPYQFVGTWTGWLAPPSPASPTSSGSSVPMARPLEPGSIYASPHARWLDIVARLVALPERAFWIAIK